MAPVRLAAAALLAWAAGCAPVGPAAEPALPRAAPAAEPARPELLEIRWVRSSAEHRAIFLQTYRAAADRLREMAAAHPAGSWAVILDADETVLDNSAYQLRRARQGLGFTPASWNEWVREEAAPALPGAAEFTRLVRELGGRVAIVTNRAAEVCDPTRRNLQAVGVAADVVLCQEGPSDKNPRFQAVQQGAGSLPPMRVVMWVGDNIRDFPEGSQALRDAPPAALQRFGRDWFLLPNPLYGSWEELGVR